MNVATTNLDRCIESGKRVVIAEISPPQGVDPAPLGLTAKRLAGKVQALAVSDNRDRVSMSALAAASLVAASGVEPILHITTRDRNRAALVSEVLGAQALGIRNVLCTSGTHQTLGDFRSAKNVYDVDPIQLLQIYSRLSSDAGVVGQKAGIAGAGPFCLGAVASPNADPLELQIGRLAKKAAAGAKFLVTQPIYDLQRFAAWWQALVRRGIHEKVAVLAGIELLENGHLASAQAGKRPSPRVPAAMLNEIASKPDAASRRAAAIQAAVDTIGRLAETPGLRGFSVSVDGDHDAALEILQRSGLGSN